MSITAAVHWHDRQYLFQGLLGCDEACQVPKTHDISVPTRYDTWMDLWELAQHERHNPGHCRLCFHTDGNHSLGPGRADPNPGVVTVIRRNGECWTLPVHEPVIVSKGQIVEIGTSESQVWQVLGRLIIDPAGGPEDPLDWSDAPLSWQTTDADLRTRFSLVDDLQWLKRWIAVGPLRVTGLQAARQVLPVAFDLRGPGVLLERTILGIGPARIGGIGPWTLRVTDGDWSTIAVARDGDHADWLVREGLAATVALALEPYDPDGDEVLFTRNRHLPLIQAVVGEPIVNLDQEALRSQLAEVSAPYQRARHALRTPSSDPGFFDALTEYVQVSLKGRPFLAESTRFD